MLSVADALVGTRSRDDVPAGLFAKRAFDVVVSLPLCLLALPVIVAAALALTFQQRTVPFFAHHRVGRGGSLIWLPKLRTLVRHTAPYADKTVTILEPPTRLARVLRESHLDELPQLFLVPFGRLSLVGPRPRMLQEAEQCGDAEYATVRTSVHQGCTGLWQISEGLASRVSDHPEYDRFYVEHRTLRLDAWILWRTGVQTLSGRRIGLGDIPRWAVRRPAPVVADAS